MQRLGKEHNRDTVRGGGVVEREQTTIRLPVELKKQIQQKADEIGISFNEFVLLAINEYINSHQN